MEPEERFEKILGSVSKEKFRQNANKLLNECFILKECPDTRNCYTRRYSKIYRKCAVEISNNKENF